MNKRRVLLLFVVLSVLFTIFSCSKEEPSEVKNREYNAKEVEEAAKILIEKSLPYNEILYGKGLDFDSEDEGMGIYKKATEESLQKYGIKSVEDLKEKLSEIYSSKYIEKKLLSTDIFSSGSDGNNLKFYARYFDEVDEDGNTYVYVNSIYEYDLKNTYEYISEPRATSSIGDLVVIKATVRATMQQSNTEKPKTKDIEHEIRLIEENGKWLLYSSTYVVYDEYTDIYENMNK